MIISPNHHPRLVVMVKEPRPGRVKTRLGKTLGMTTAAWWFRHQTRRLIRRLRDPRWDLILAVSPDYEGLTSRVWPDDLPRMAQGHGDLGDRMKRVFLNAPTGPVAIIGADIPGIQKAHIAQAFQALGSADTVFGPAPDGGYWLIGMKRMRPIPPTLFRDVRWSTKHALQDTKDSIPNFRIAEINTLRDVDEVSDL